ncbi:MAG: dockerin type I repeat-containing protein [Clostridia bacterium]|nr:dockerin type I repeat-containing protein [Clostridia bacterium]
MKRTVKKGLAAIITACMLLSVVCALGSVGFTVSAGHPDYYEFTEMPGFCVWTDEELAMIDREFTAAPVHSTDNLPEGVDDAVKFTVTSTDKQWGSATITSGMTLNKNTATNEPGLQWGAMALPGGKSIVGDKSFENCDGICFWVGGVGGRYEGKMKIQLFLAECRGPYYDYNKGLDDGTNEYGSMPVGYRYESSTKATDTDGYIFFSFEDEFRQVDWWATDDDGIDQSVYTNGNMDYVTPIPEKARKTMNGLAIVFTNVSVGTNIYLADVKGYKDTRVFLDNLDDAVSRFDALNPDAYTEASYNAATEIYLGALEMLMDGAEGCTQAEVNSAARRLNSAIDSLDSMFPVESETKIAGFEVWDDDDLLDMTDGGLCTDVAYIEEGENGPEICIISTASTGAPDYGWSRFISAIDDGDGGYEALKNPFDADMSDTAGLCFRIAYSGDFQPTDIQLGVGATGGPYFVAINPDVVFPLEPEREGLVYVSWAAFYDEEGDEDIYDYLADLDFFELRLPDSTQEEFRISDLYAFDWAINDADFAPLDEAIAAAEEETGALNAREYYPAGWEAYQDAIEAAKVLPDVYGVTADDVAEAIAAIAAARNALIPIGEANYELIKGLHETYKAARNFWYGNYTLSAGTKLTRALENYEKVIDTAISDEDANKLVTALETAVTGLKAIAPKNIKEGIYSFEDYTDYDLDYCMAFRSSGVVYSIDRLDGGSDSLSMKAVRRVASNGDTAAISFYPFYNNYLTRPLLKGELVGDMSGITGFFFDVEVNDLTLAKDAKLRFGVKTNRDDKKFDKSADGIPLPASGKGRIYIPTYAMTVDGAEGGSIALNNIDAYYFVLNGSFAEGFEIKLTNVGAYSGTTNSVPETPQIINVAEGDTCEAGFMPMWNDGVAILDGEVYVYGTPIMVNGPHNLQVGTGQNYAEVNFTITGGVDPEEPPVAGIKGDMDGDGEITVADALKALRIAAKLVEPTAEDLALGDTDGDGEITVADALKILRVAAKLAGADTL